jgi:hypothetical protein
LSIAVSLKRHGKLRSEGELGRLVVLAEGNLAVRMRRLDQRENSISLVSQMARYARDLVACNPKDSLAHLAMSEAYVKQELGA